METCRARRRLVTGIPLVGNWSEMQPTSQRQDVLPVWVLTGVLSPPVLNLGLDIFNLGFHVVLGYLVLKEDPFTIKGGPNLGPRQ
jgi:hypothetical protein